MKKNIINNELVVFRPVNGRQIIASTVTSIRITGDTNTYEYTLTSTTINTHGLAFIHTK